MMTLDVDDDVERKGRGIIAPRQAFTGLAWRGTYSIEATKLREAVGSSMQPKPRIRTERLSTRQPPYKKT